MKKVLVLAAFAVVSAFAQTAVPMASAPTNMARKAVKDMTPEERAAHREKVRRIKEKYFGGNVVRAGSQKGSIAFISAIGGESPDLAMVAAAIKKATKFDLRMIAAEAPKTGVCDAAQTMLGKSGSELAVILVQDANTPAMLVAPEDRWAVVNAQKLAAGLPEVEALRKRLLGPRIRKEVIRAFSQLCGGAASQFPGNVMDAASIEELDTVQEFLPVDMPNRFETYLGKLGVKPAYEKTYLQACKEGWAPAPTNDFQKAIWQKIHSEKERGPTNPIKIAPPAKK